MLDAGGGDLDADAALERCAVLMQEAPAPRADVDEQPPCARPGEKGAAFEAVEEVRGRRGVGGEVVVHDRAAARRLRAPLVAAAAADEIAVAAAEGGVAAGEAERAVAALGSDHGPSRRIHRV